MDRWPALARAVTGPRLIEWLVLLALLAPARPWPLASAPVGASGVVGRVAPAAGSARGLARALLSATEPACWPDPPFVSPQRPEAQP